MEVSKGSELERGGGVLHVSICYLIHNDRLLVTDINPEDGNVHSGVIVAPRSIIQAEETPYRAISRGFAEGTGLILRNLEYVGCAFFNNEDRTGLNGEAFGVNTCAWIYHAKNSSGKLRPTDRDGNRNVWISTAHVLDHPMHDGDQFMWRQLTGHDWSRFDAYIKHQGIQLDKKQSYIDFH